MAHIRPFSAIRYVSKPDLDFSNLIAPPYDVLDDAQKAGLQSKHPNNIVTVDLPFTPPKSVGPDEVYERADITLKSWLAAGILKQDARPAMYPYMQSYEHHGRTFHRRGFFCLVKLSPFGQGQVVPHEKTYKGPIEDRMKLMRATGAQLSPIFGLFSDPRGEVNKLLFANAGKPELDGSMDSVRNQLWSVIDADVERQVIDFINAKPIYIADGHHRYTTALGYQYEQQQLSGGELPLAHPANWCLFSLVAMQDDGLIVLPTHRILGGLTNWNMNSFIEAIKPNFKVTATPLKPDLVDEYIEVALAGAPAHTFGLYDGTTKTLYELKCINPDVLKSLEPEKSDAWRKLDVAILQRYLLDEVIQPTFNGGKEPAKSYTAYPKQVVPMTDGTKNQIAILLKSTPVNALEQLGKHGEVMPQKSTFFYPKLATGMVINPLR